MEEDEEETLFLKWNRVCAFDIMIFATKARTFAMEVIKVK